MLIDGGMFVRPEELDADVAEQSRRLRYWIKTRRAELGMSKNMLIRLSGISKTGINYVVNGEREPGIRTICALARALDMTVLELLAPVPDYAAREVGPALTPTEPKS